MSFASPGRPSQFFVQPDRYASQMGPRWDLGGRRKNYMHMVSKTMRP